MTAQPKLRVSAGPSPDKAKLKPLRVNADSQPFHISSPNFEGDIVVRIKNFHGEPTKAGETVLAQPESGYFEKHTEVTWSIQFAGTFKVEGQELSADDVLWGNTFDEPIYDFLPYGTTAALAVLKQIDPSLEHDLKGSKPWALSPMLATMNYVSVAESGSGTLSSRPAEDMTPLIKADDGPNNLKDNGAARRRYLADPAHRQAIRLDGGKVIEADFTNGFVDFNDLSLKIGNVLHISLKKYWNGQPVRYVCRSRDGKYDFFTVVFDIIEGADPVKPDADDGSAAAAGSEANKDEYGVD